MLTFPKTTSVADPGPGASIFFGSGFVCIELPENTLPNTYNSKMDMH